jgi:hypothetical protein
MTPNWINGAIRQAVALILFCALILAPVIVVCTHGPGDVVSAMQADTIKAAHGHTHDWDEPGEPGQHDATDHEHQVAVALFGGDTSIFELKSASWSVEFGFPAGLSRDGPRRPPRVSIV